MGTDGHCSCCVEWVGSLCLFNSWNHVKLHYAHFLLWFRPLNIPKKFQIMERSVRDLKAIISSLRLFQFETWARFSPLLKMAEILRWMNDSGFCMKYWWGNQSGDTWESVWGQFNAWKTTVSVITLMRSSNSKCILKNKPLTYYKMILFYISWTTLICAIRNKSKSCLSICHNLCTWAISRIDIYMLYRQSSLTPTIKENRFTPETLFHHYSLQYLNPITP